MKKRNVLLISLLLILIFVGSVSASIVAVKVEKGNMGYENVLINITNIRTEETKGGYTNSEGEFIEDLRNFKYGFGQNDEIMIKACSSENNCQEQIKDLQEGGLLISFRFSRFNMSSLVQLLIQMGLTIVSLISLGYGVNIALRKRKLVGVIVGITLSVIGVLILIFAWLGIKIIIG